MEEREATELPPSDTDAQTAQTSDAARTASDAEKAKKIAEAKAKAAAQVGAPKAPVKKKDEAPRPVDASNDSLVLRLKKIFPHAITAATKFLDQLSIHIVAADIVAVCRNLHDDARTPFDYLTDLTCVHLPERGEAPFEIVYHLYSIPANARVRLKAATSAEVGVETVTGVWPAANWMEREVYDLFGVAFRGHPDLRRLLLPPDWEGHPLRKDYPLEAVENEWTRKHLPASSSISDEQKEQRRRYGLEMLSEIDERRVREVFRAGREVMPLDKR